MKNLLFVFCSLLLFISCNNHDEKQSIINIEEQVKIMKQDPIATEYFEATANLAKLITENELDIPAFRKLLKENNQTSCNAEKEIFNGNIVMENYAVMSCRVMNANQNFKNKYPFLKDISREEKLKLFTPLTIAPKLDLELIKEKAEKNIPANIKEELINLISGKTDVDMNLLMAHFGVDEEELLKIAEKYKRID